MSPPHRYQSLLEQAGYRVRVVPYSVAAAVSADAAASVIIVQLDALAVSGGLLVRELRTQPTTRGTPVVALMRSDDAHTRDQIVRAGATAILIEPVKPPMLLRQLRRLLSRMMVGARVDSSPAVMAPPAEVPRV